MAEDERIGDKHTENAPEVEGHGAKKVVGTGLAAAALVGAGVAGVKLAGDDGQPNQRIAGALTTSDEAPSPGDLKAADRDGDGYVTSAELAQEGFKWDVTELNEKGLEVSATGLSLAGFKQSLDSLGTEGFAIKGESIMIKQGVDEELDKLLDGSAQEWTKKVRELDLEGDGYAATEELGEAGFKFDASELEEAGIKISSEELEKAGYKLPLQSLGEGGFMIKGESIMIKQGVDAELDALLGKD